MAYSPSHGTGQAPEPARVIAFFAEGPPGEAIGAYHLRLLANPDACAPECHAYGQCSTDRKRATRCDEPGAAAADHLVHEPGRCRCGPPYGSKLLSRRPGVQPGGERGA